MAGEWFMAGFLVSISVLIIAILRYYGDKSRFAWYVQLTCFIAYFVPFTIMVMLPLDLASVYRTNQTKYRICLQNSGNCLEPFIHVSDKFLYVFWQIVYWITFNIQMFFVPIMQGYVRSGAFSFSAKLKQAVIGNLIFYAIIIVPTLAFVLYALFVMHTPLYLLINKFFTLGPCNSNVKCIWFIITVPPNEFWAS